MRVGKLFNNVLKKTKNKLLVGPVGLLRRLLTLARTQPVVSKKYTEVIMILTQSSYRRGSEYAWIRHQVHAESTLP